jgi:pyruvate/2-oxoacid:ferredoxin oxidoreductase beta subunit
MSKFTRKCPTVNDLDSSQDSANPHGYWVCEERVVSYVFFPEKKKQTNKKEKKEDVHRESYIYIYLKRFIYILNDPPE